MTTTLNGIALGICIIILLFCLWVIIKCSIYCLCSIIDCYYESKSCAKYREQCEYKDLSEDFSGFSKEFKTLTWMNVFLFIFSFAAIAFTGYTLYDTLGLFIGLFV